MNLFFLSCGHYPTCVIKMDMHKFFMIKLGVSLSAMYPRQWLEAWSLGDSGHLGVPSFLATGSAAVSWAVHVVSCGGTAGPLSTKVEGLEGARFSPQLCEPVAILGVCKTDAPVVAYF